MADQEEFITTPCSMEKARHVKDWLSFFNEASERRKWGQVVEAAEQYTKISRQMRSMMDSESRVFSEHEKRYLQQAQKELRQQAIAIQDISSFEGQSKEQIERIELVLKSILLGKGPGMEGSGAAQSLAPSTLTITIEKIGIKNPDKYFQPFICVNVRDVKGALIEDELEIPYSSNFVKNYIIFNSSVQLKTPFIQLPTGFAIFLELKHYKPSKRRTSVKCYSIMEQDELKPGPLVLEIYKKPVDVTRQKVSLFTQKPLYLHVSLAFS